MTVTSAFAAEPVKKETTATAICRRNTVGQYFLKGRFLPGFILRFGARSCISRVAVDHQVASGVDERRTRDRRLSLKLPCWHHVRLY